MFKDKNKREIAIFILAVTGIINSLFLMVFEIMAPGICPSFLNVSGCYISLTAFGFIFLAYFIKNQSVFYILFYIGVFSGFIIDSIFSYRALFNVIEYPKIGPIPISLFSCGLFFCLIVLNISNYKKTSSQEL